MKLQAKIIYFLLEFIFGVGAGLLGTILIEDELLKLDMILSMLMAFVSVLLFSLIGIWIPGFFHSKMKKAKFLNGILNSIIYLFVGLILGIILDLITINFIPNRITAIVNIILLPIFISVFGFHTGLETYPKRTELND